MHKILFLRYSKSNLGFTLLELLITISLTTIISLLAIVSYQKIINNSYTKSVIQEMLIDANFMDAWYQHHGSFVDNSSNKSKWPSIPIVQYIIGDKKIYDIHLSPIAAPNSHYYHLIATPTIASGLKGTGCICIDNDHNVFTGMSKDCNNSTQKC